MKITTREFGIRKDGTMVTAYRLEGAGGLVLEALDWGGRIVSIEAPDAKGEKKDIVLGFDSPCGWEDGDPYYGCIIGRYANRIAGGKFSLDGKDYTLTCNNFPGGIGCALHGADGGWHDRMWRVETFEQGTDVGLTFSLDSPAGEGGFPGKVSAKVTYTLTAQNIWRVDYEATTDAPTPIAMTQHVYFNLKGEAGGTVEDHMLQVNAEKFLPYGADQIPTGELRAVAGSAFDFQTAHKIGERIDEADDVLKAGKGYDHCWVINGTGFRFAATLSGFGRQVDVWTDEPGVQIYTGNWIEDGFPAKRGEKLCARCGVALETGHFPDSPNKAAFPSTILRPGETLRSRTEFRFRVQAS